ncbi:dicarboxylate/amino acid:cation symporter [Burkholderia gladioli]|uniref:dicarboxylate/amino acid:cation symporter n=1 Tax=Burkholderia gladioli TaxID=28095 RepID=UPI000CFE58EF|nr:dicarboxylate/amino acid:cation symporter [Burkholderia gladioli]MBU9271096.1 dicarboxylate/amino acid:cation symporter [Burkholderia gladioli]MDN7812980.1 dicarboxylate/amino acid:cation symporter [Burkholderia gladioli]PRH07442.1 sodium:dicarboxylate symporter [Burkholderia gladioli]
MSQKNSRTSLPLLMIVALILGAIAGVTAPRFAADVGFLSTMFGHAIKMVVMPLILLSVTVGSYRAVEQRRNLGRTALVTILFFIVMTLVSSSLGLGLNWIFRPGLGAPLTESGALPEHLASSIDWVKFITDLIPQNLVAALSSGNAIPVLVFGVLLGTALGATGEAGRPAINLFASLLAGLFKMVEWIVALSPLAIFAAVAGLMSSRGVSGLMPLVKLLGISYLGMLILGMLLSAIVIAAGQRPLAVIRKVSEPLILAFTTRSSEITYPVHLKKLTEMGVPQSVASTILPLSYIFNRDGAVLYTALAVGYLADAYHVAWSWPLALTILVLTIITIDGAANVPSGAIVAITIVLAAIGLPAEAVLLILGVDAFFDMGRTALNVYASTVAMTVSLRLTRSEDQAAADELDGGASLRT